MDQHRLVPVPPGSTQVCSFGLAFRLTTPMCSEQAAYLLLFAPNPEISVPEAKIPLCVEHARLAVELTIALPPED